MKPERHEHPVLRVATYTSTRAYKAWALRGVWKSTTWATL